MKRRPILILVALAVIVAPAWACVPDDQRTDTLDPETAGRVELSDETIATLEAANALFRDGDYEGALEEYRAVTRAAPESATGWFGIYMAHQALGETAAADSALERAQGLAPGASLIRDTLPGGRSP